MANTWTLLIQGKAFSAGGVIAGILNVASRVLRIRRIGFINYQTVAVTGVLCAGEIRRYTGAGWTTPTSVSPFPHDTINSALVSVTLGHAGTPTGTPTVLRRYQWSSDEAAVSGATLDEWELLPPLGLLWDAGFGDANVQPLVLRTNESLMIVNTVGAAGLVDIYIEFTDEAS
jgi:hypothetical protein